MQSALPDVRLSIIVVRYTRNSAYSEQCLLRGMLATLQVGG
jgi:hypothetical protein